MAEILFLSGKAALEDHIRSIDMGVRGRLDERGINATGRLKKSHRTEVISGGDVSSATLFALSYWRRAGSGSPPGTVADLDALKEWLLAKNIVKGVNDPSWIAELIQDKIYLEGSRDFRRRNTNAYRDVIDESQKGIPDVLKAFLRDFNSPMDKAFTAAFKVA